MLRRLLIPVIPAVLVGSALLAGSTAHATDIGWDLTRPSAPTAA